MKHISERKAQNWIATVAAAIGAVAFSGLAVVQGEPVWWGFTLLMLAYMGCLGWRATRPDGFFEKQLAKSKQPWTRWQIIGNLLGFTAAAAFLISRSWSNCVREDFSAWSVGSLVAYVVLLSFLSSPLFVELMKRRKIG